MALASFLLGGLIMALASLSGCCSQPIDRRSADEPLVVRVTADRPESCYVNHEKATFTIDVTYGGQRANRGKVEVWLSKDGSPEEIHREQFDLSERSPIQIAGTVDESAFLLCQAWASVDQAHAYGERLVWYRPPIDPNLTTIDLAPDRSDALYHPGEQATFTARVMQNGQPVTEGRLELRLSREGAEGAVAQQTFDLAEGLPLKISGTLHDASFLYCQATLTRDEGKGDPVFFWTSVGFDVDKIHPEVTMPEDFEAFWRDTLAKTRQLPMEVELEELGAYSHARATYYRFSINSLNKDRFYGFLGVPTGPGPFPAIVLYPGAGPGWWAPSDMGLSSRGVITLMMNVHRYPVADSPAEAERQYEQSRAQRGTAGGALTAAPSRETHDSYAMLAGFCRALDYICSRDDWDRKHLVAMGSSQGGFLTLVTAGLYADKVTWAIAGVPARCDFPRRNKASGRASLKSAAYYDGVNFARLVRCPVRLSVGFRDSSCPPANVFSAYNSIPSKDKNILMLPHDAHDVTPQRQTSERDLILRGLGLR